VEHGQLRGVYDWMMLVDVGPWLVFPPEIAINTLRSDIVLWSSYLKNVFIIKLTVPWEDSVDDKSENNYAMLN